MRAIRVHPEGELTYEQVDDPRPAPGEVVVQLRAAGVNRRDVWVRRGTYPFPLPLIPGSDGAGVREDSGEEVVILPSLFWGDSEEMAGPGFQILGGPRDGTYATRVVVPEENLFPRPANLSWVEAAAFPLAGVTSHRALFSRGGLRSGETVLIHGAGSGVSTFLIQLAHHAGARVIVTSSSDDKLLRARQLGADEGVDYTAEDHLAQLRELGPIDLVIDSVGSTLATSMEVVRPGGRVVLFGATGGEEVSLPIRPIYLGHKSLMGTSMGSPADFRALLDVVGELTPIIDSVYPLADAGDALARLDAQDHFGKVVLEIGPTSV